METNHFIDFINDVMNVEPTVIELKLVELHLRQVHDVLDQAYQKLDARPLHSQNVVLLVIVIQTQIKSIYLIILGANVDERSVRSQH